MREGCTPCLIQASDPDTRKSIPRRRAMVNIGARYPLPTPILAVTTSTRGEVGRTKSGEAQLRRYTPTSLGIWRRGPEITLLRLRRFPFSLFLVQQALSFCTRHHLCRQGMTLAGGQQLGWQGSLPERVPCIEGRSREGGNGGGDGWEESTKSL